MTLPVGSDGVVHGFYKADQNVKVLTDAHPSVPGDGTALNWSQAGPAGPQGEQGPAGPAGVSGYEIITQSASVTTTSNPACITDLSLTIPEGKVVVGSGVSELALTEWASGPDPEDPGKWNFHLTTITPNQGGYGPVTVTCWITVIDAS